MKTLTKNFKKFAMLLSLVLGMSALISAQSKTPLKVADLQKSITNHIAKDYMGYTIKDAYKIDKNKVITYDVNIAKGNEKLCLAFDNSGKFLKVIEPNNKTNNKSTASNSATSMNTKGSSKVHH
jgi:hypothetical protein